MARHFESSNSQYLEYYASGWAPIRNLPTLTMSCWFLTNNDTTNQVLISYCDKQSGQRMRLSAAGAESGNPIQVNVVGTFFTYRRSNPPYTARTQNPFETGVWQHAVLRGDGRPFINGSGDYYLAPNESGSFGRLNGIETISVGAETGALGPTLHFSGAIAEVALWNVNLTDTEIQQLSLGFSPQFIRPQNLIYAPMFGKDLPEPEIMNHLDLRPSPSEPTDFNDHPPIFRPAPKFNFFSERETNKIVLNGLGISSSQGFGIPSFSNSNNSSKLVLNFGFRPIPLVNESAGNTHSLNDLTDKWVGIFAAEDTFNPTHLGYCQQSITSTQVEYLISLQKIDNNAVPDGVRLVSGLFTPTTGTRVFRWIPVTDSGYEVQRGDLLGVVVQPTTEPPNTMTVSPGPGYGTIDANSYIPYKMENSTILKQDWSTGAIKDSGNFVNGVSTATFHRTSVSTSGHRQALKFRIPSTVMEHFTIEGVRALVNTQAGSGVARFGLWQNNILLAKKDVQMENLVASTNASTTTTSLNVEVYFDTISPVLNADTTYYIGVERTNLNVALYGNSYSEQDDLPVSMSGICFSQSNGTTWTDTRTALPNVQIIFGDIAG